MKKTKLLLFLAIMLFMHFNGKSQSNLLPVQQYISDLQLINEEFHPVSLFRLPEERSEDGIGKYIHFTIDPAELQKTLNAGFRSIKLIVPLPGGATVNLLLTQHSILADDFRLTVTDKNGLHEIPSVAGLYYQGVIEGYNMRSMAACSIFEDQLACVISDETGNWNLGALKGKENEYAYYNDRTFKIPYNFTCGTSDRDGKENQNGSGNNPNVTTVGNCIKMFYDCDSDFYAFEGGNVAAVTAVVTRVVSLFNEVSVIYGNENVAVSIQQIHVWQTDDHYRNNSSANALADFKTQYPSINGNEAQLLAMDHLSNQNLNNGGLADVIGQICPGYSYCNINAVFNTFPAYSQNANFMSHELGHTLGSPHTHWCGWSGGPIDNCNLCWPVPCSACSNTIACTGCPPPPFIPFEGNCTTGPNPPPTGGTIMSYCHGCTVGMDLRAGFGQQPGDTIRRFISNHSSCLTNCTTTCLPVIGVGIPINSGNVATYNAQFMVYGNNIIQSGATVSFNAGDSIKLNPGFNAQAGSNFIAGISACTPVPAFNSLSGMTNRNATYFSKENTVEIIPNPFHSSFDLSINSNEDGKATVIIYNPLGLKVKETLERNLIKGNNKISFNCSDLAPGVYLVEINCGDLKTVKRIVKM